jgi:hypothetical protein
MVGVLVMLIRLDVRSVRNAAQRRYHLHDRNIWLRVRVNCLTASTKADRPNKTRLGLERRRQARKGRL